MKKIIAVLIQLIFVVSLHSQHDRVIYKTKKPGFYQDSILPGIAEFEKKNNEHPKEFLFADLYDKDFPTDTNDYQQIWHNPPISQGATGTCWSFSSVSFIESEIFRQTGQKIKLSEMFYVYFEYLERARAFVKNRGEIFFGEGSETNAVPKLMKIYGAVPFQSYTGLLKDQIFFDHQKMTEELSHYLDGIKDNNTWNEEVVLTTFRDILNHYMLEPPDIFSFEGKQYTPKDFLSQIVKINPDDYVSFMSTMSKTFNQKGELEEPDNWWHDANYYNIELDQFLSVFKNALKSNYTICFCGDVSEPGYDRFREVGIVPSFDIPSEYIDEHSREFRLSNNSTTDDHCMHAVGFKETDSDWWFLIKDSSSTGFDGAARGYHFIHEDYIKLKILTILVYKYGAKNVLDNIIK